MILSYVDILGDGERHRINATITTEHSLSSYGQPVILLDDGQPLDLTSWVLLGYQVIQATENEVELLKRVLRLIALSANASGAAAALGRLGGKATSPAKTAANRAKANMPPKPGHKPRGRQKKNG
jgi:hypothetical protein